MTALEKKEIFISDLMTKLENKLTDRLSIKFETCYRAPCFGWSVEEYMYMPIVADRLRQKGYIVTSSVSYEVTDWIIAV